MLTNTSSSVGRRISTRDGVTADTRAGMTVAASACLSSEMFQTGPSGVAALTPATARSFAMSLVGSSGSNWIWCGSNISWMPAMAWSSTFSPR